MKSAVGLVFVLVCSTALASEPVQRTLTFDERVNAQRAIERVYYAHQLGATKEFHTAVPATVIEAKVHTYLDESAALTAYWKTAVTDQMLQRELERMAQGTRMPERLQELYAALGNDPFRIEECLARPAVVDRLTHNFYAFDATLHVKAREQAESLQRQLAAGEIDPSANHPNRHMIELIVGGSDAAPPRSDVTSPQPLTPEEFRKRRSYFPSRIAQVSEVQETRDAFTISVVLNETTTSVSVASYVVPKIAWDAWWADARLRVRGDAVVAVASGSTDVPAPHQARPNSPITTCADDYWDNGSLDDVVPGPRSQHVAVWTGTQMIVWGGASRGFPVFQSGGRYDPATDSWTPTSMTGAPDARVGATAVWTGHEMVVWGGQSYFGSETQFSSGGRYDPVSDRWTPTSGRSVPGPRYDHTAIWTGSRMVVWGGSLRLHIYPYDFVWKTGGQYDPATDTWTSTSIVGAPAARSGHTAVWTGSLMVIWGGNFLQTGGRYDPNSNRWTATSQIDAPPGDVGHSAVWTGTEMIVWGGQGRYADYVNIGGRYNPVSDAWAPTSTLNAPSARFRHGAVWTGSRMLVWGGRDGNGYGFLDTGGRYDPTTDSWLPTSQVNAPQARSFQSVIWTGSLMLIWGGEGHATVGYPLITLNSGGRYDPATDNWTSTDASRGHGGTNQTAVWTGNLVLLWTDGGRYDAITDSWTYISADAAPPYAPSGYTAVWSGTRMVVWGGNTNSYPPDQLDAGGRYDPISDSWSATSTTDAPAARAGHTAVWTGDSMVIWGGYSGYYGGTYHDLDSGGRYDPEADTWAPTSRIGAPSAREKHTAAWTGTAMVVWGGGTGDGADRIYPSVNTGGRYDPAADTWVPTSTTNAPVERAGHTAIWTGTRMIVWGGRTDVYGAASGRYDPTTDLWTPTSTINAPKPRELHSALWTGRLMVVWGGYALTGGTGRGALSGDGARYDPAADGWSPMSKTGQPEARARHSAIWAGSEMIVLGGEFLAGYVGGGGGRYFPGTAMDDDCDGEGITGYAGDCDDHDPTVYPGAAQICDGINNDCNSPTWPTLPNDTNEIDADGDGFLVCRDDCDDTRSTVYPHAPQLCDGINNDCHDSAWPALPPNEADADHDGSRVCAGDCDDNDPYRSPLHSERCDGRDNDCDGIIDDGLTAASCDDYNPCTDDFCGGVIGCLHASNHNPCDDHNVCTSNDVCGGGECSGTPSPGVLCNDHNACTTGDACDDQGRCTGIAPCDDGNPCTREYSYPEQNCECFNVWEYEAPCDDGNPCTAGDRCTPFPDGIRCASDQPATCDDGNPCTDDSCTLPTGCAHTPNTGAACDDGNACTQGDICQVGTCIGGGPTDCFAPCPTGSIATQGGCALTYEIAGDALDNLDGTCDPLNPTDRYSDCFLAYGFHWTDLGRAIGPVLRVEVELATGRRCSSGPRSVILNGAEVGTFVPSVACACPSQPEVVAVTASSVDSYAPSGLNRVYVLPQSGCEGLHAGDDLGGSFARVTVTYERRTGPCVVATCDSAVGGCIYANDPEGTLCNDNNPCTDDSCNPATGCVHVNNTNTCDDGNACTAGDTCGRGSCHAGTPIVCQALDQCHVPGVCTAATGTCSNPPKPNGTTCDDGSLCTTNDVCQNGLCTPTFSGLNHPHPRSSGYYHQLCEKAEHQLTPYHGDQLTDADAVCVAGITPTFSDLRTVADICGVIDDDGHHGGRHHGGDGGPGTKECDKAENELIATALNICRARVCEAQNVDSRCGADEHHVTETTVAASFSDANAILDDANRTKDTCQHARCELKEINSGHALEMNSLHVTRAPGGVRLSWLAMDLEDGTGMPDKYEVWRRPLNASANFTKIGETTTALTFVDGTAGTGMWEYEVTADIP